MHNVIWPPSRGKLVGLGATVACLALVSLSAKGLSPSGIVLLLIAFNVVIIAVLWDNGQ